MKRDILHIFIGTLCGLLLAGILRSWFSTGEEPDVARYREVRDFVRSNYVREVGERELLESALHGMIDNLDRYSRFLGRDQVADFERETGGRYRGIGVIFQTPINSGRVLFCLRDSPAARAGVRVGDRVRSIDGTQLSDLTDAEVSRRLGRSEKDTVELEIVSRGDEARHLTVERSELVDPTVRHERMLDVRRGVGYLAIVAFSHQTPEEFDRAVDRLVELGARSLVIDVRGDPGGVLASAVQIVNRFVANGVVVSTEGRDEPSVYEAVPAEARFVGMPLIVLADQDSASASEVLAGALQDYRAAVLVGAPTYGKGMVQKIHGFGDGEAVVKLTNSYYYTPSHRNLERTVDKAWEFGLVPDLSVDVSQSVRAKIHAFLQLYSPPSESLDDLRAWERDEHVSLIPEPPDDPQLDAALALFRGERPSALAAATESAHK